MRIAGIVAEYNPFHLGHQYQIQETREMLGEDCGIVCVMSGDFVQRGEPAIFSKFSRAEAAVRCGADLVIELPLPWCMSTAEYFARGAVQILGELGIVDVLSFGSETGSVETLTKVAECLCGDMYHAELHHILSNEKISFAACRQAAIERLLGKEYGDVLSRANDNLAVEYLKVIRTCGYPMRPLAIKRIGAEHDTISEEEIRSGSDLRNMLLRGETIRAYTPTEAEAVFGLETQQGRGPITVTAMEPLLLSRLRMLDENAFSAIPDAGEGLEHKLFSACGTQPTLNDIYDKVKSKRYTHARVRRMTISAALGIQKMQLFESPPYARILAFNTTGAAILKTAKERSTMPIISKPAVVKTLDARIQGIFNLNSKAHDLYVLSYQNAGFHAGGQDWQESPRYIC